MLQRFKDRQNNAIDSEPLVFPEQSEEPLYLTERNDLGKKSHDPILAELKDLDPLLFEL